MNGVYKKTKKIHSEILQTTTVHRNRLQLDYQLHSPFLETVSVGLSIILIILA